MKKAMIKLASFVGVFLVSLAVIGFFMNRGNTDMTGQMGEATLPIVAIGFENLEMNPMRGYVETMEPAGMRDGIVLVGENRQVDAVIHTYGEKISSAFYELRSIDGQRLIESTPLTSLTEQGNDLYAGFRLKDLIEEETEYSLIFVLTLEDGREVRYYARVMQAEYALKEKLDFVLGFSEATFDPEKMKEYSRYLEVSKEEKNATLARVNIHCTAKQVAWGGLAVKRETEPEIRVTEIAPQTASVVLSYQVSYTANGRPALAEVEEYFRVRHTADRMYLLDYERTARQLFLEDVTSFSDEKISLGITDTDVDMVESDGGTVFAFSHAGELFCYNGADGKLARLFSFYDNGRDDARTRYREHDFKILKVDETGNVTFLVHGYMNRGRHEGRCGVQVCYYSSTLNVVEELAFLPYRKAPEILRADMENLSFVNGKNDLYLMMDGSIFHINLEDKSSTVVVQGLCEDSYRVSGDGSMLAWQETAQAADSKSLVLMNLNSGEKAQIEAGRDGRIRPLGFMGEDFIYGIAATEEIQRDVLGNTIFPMHRIVIRSFNGKVLKTYEQSGYFVTECTISENQIDMERVQKAESGLIPASADQILYSDTIPASRNYLETAVTENLETVVQIVLRSAVDSKKIKFLTPKEVLFEGSRDIALPLETQPDRYYVYGKTGVLDIFSDPAKAAALAYENAGSVVSADGAYVLKRDRLHTSNQIMAIGGEQAQGGESSLAVCLNAIFRFEGLMRDSAHLLNSGKDVMTILQENLEDRTILNLGGSSLDLVLYYPDREIPVLAMLEDGSAVLIIGFNEQNVVLMDPQSGTVYKKGMNDSRAWFEENGNRFVAYW